MRLTIVGRDLPGARCADRTDVQVGVQRGREAEQWWSAGEPEVRWRVELAARTGRDGSRDVAGPHVQGRPGGRFVYLVWTGVDAAGRSDRFRRLKLPLDPAADPLAGWLSADRDGTVALGLTAADGTPRCASVPADALRWADPPPDRQKGAT